MKKASLVLIFVLGFVLIPNKVLADCSYAEQNKLNAAAANVKGDYTVGTKKQVIEGVGGDGSIIKETVDKKYFVVNLYNLTKEMYVIVSNDYASGEKTYYYKDTKNGVLSFNAPTNETPVEYTVTINSYGIDSQCNELKLRVMTVRTPQTNRFYDYQVCQGDAKEFYLCQEFLLSDFEISDSDFFARVDKYLEGLKKDDEKPVEEPNSNIFNKTINFIINYWYYVISGIIVVGLVVAIIVIVRIRRRDI